MHLLKKVKTTFLAKSILVLKIMHDFLCRLPAGQWKMKQAALFCMAIWKHLRR